MTEPQIEKKTSDTPSSEPPASELLANACGASKRTAGWGLALLFVIALALAAGAAFFYLDLDRRVRVVSTPVRQTAAPSQSLERAHRGLANAGLAHGPSSVTIDGAPDGPLGDEEEAPPENAPPSPAVKHDPKGFESALSGMEVRLKQLEESVSQDQTRAHVVLAGLAALVPLEMIALEGQSFVPFYVALQDVAVADSKFAALVAPLEPLASTGVATATQIRASYESKFRQAIQAQKEADATDWFDRLKVALEGLVSVRRVDDAASPWQALEKDIDDGHWEAAQQDIESLPPVARTHMALLADQIAHRQTLENALRAVGLYLASFSRGPAGEN